VGGAFGNSASEGVFNMSGGSFNDSLQAFSIANTGGAIGVANLSGGTLTDNYGIHVGDRGTGILNVSGSAAVNFTGGPLQFGLSGYTTVGTVNLLGGTVTANNVGVAGTSTSLLNFNGGYLTAGAASATFMQGLTGAYIYSGGATIDDGGFAITNAQALLAPTGNGVSSIPVATGGSGYLDTPIVNISGGGGTGASAVANVSGGAVTSITVVCPGSGYTSAPTVTLYGGGYTTAATLGTVTIAANTGGGLTKNGGGILTLSGANTYTGNTTINAGTLELVQPTLPLNATVNVAGGVLQLDFTTTNSVTNLVLSGVSQPLGVYNNASSPSYLTGTGSLKVVAPIVYASNPTNITFTVSGSTINLSWPADHLGWLVQSNSVNLAVPADWYDLSNTASGTSYGITINPAQTNVFYRLRKP
jgi:autotransporter-associated beta strand protein